MKLGFKNFQMIINRFFFDFAKLGEEESTFLLSTKAISIFVDFYLKAIKQSPENVVSVRNIIFYVHGKIGFYILNLFSSSCFKSYQ
jgi:hypothetical protein